MMTIDWGSILSLNLIHQTFSSEFHVEITLASKESGQLHALFQKIREWCKDNLVVVGVAEMAIGAGVIAYALQNGLIEASAHAIAAISDPLFNNASKIGAGLGGTIGYVAGSIIGSIGVVALGGAIGIPATVVAGGAAVIMGLAGYSAGDLLHNFMNAIDYQALALNGSIFLIGLGLLIDGARRCLKSESVQTVYSKLKGSTIFLADISVVVIAGTTKQVVSLAKKALTGKGEAMATGACFGLTAYLASGAMFSTAILGSPVLTSLAVSLGLISTPPLIPIVMCAGAAGFSFSCLKNKIF